MDIFQTIRASIVTKIDEERLRLGTNLLKKEMLIKKLGYDNVNRELAKKLNYYSGQLIERNDAERLKKIEKIK